MEMHSGGVEPLLRVDGLRVDVAGGRGIVDDVSFELTEGTALGIVGESGCGKTTVALSLLGYARPGTRIRRAAFRSAVSISFGSHETSYARRAGAAFRSLHKTRQML